MKKIIPIAVTAGIVIIALSIFFYVKKSTRNVVDSFIAGRKMINILIAGGNEFRENKHSFYAILSINPENNKIGITFIPPEFRIDLNGKGRKFSKINQVEIDDFNILSSSLELDLKLNIPFYAVLYSPDVEKMVDLFEGVDLYVLDDLNIHGIHFGLNYFDGNKINQYINSAEENSIYKKYDRIQDILLTLYSDKERYEKFINTDFITRILKSIKTNMMPQEVVSLGKFLYRKESDVICTMVPGFFNDEYYVMDDIAYKTYKNDFLKKLVVDNDAEQQIKVKVLNGTEIAGLAKKVRHKLVNEGFNVVEFGTASYPLFEKTVIINRKGEIAPAKRVAGLLGVKDIYHIVDSSQLINMVVIVGTDMSKQQKP